MKDGEGSGLGLAIARAIVSAHDGTIAVASQLAKGTVFSIHLPGAVAGS
jgi:signal transduction histidine kinase